MAFKKATASTDVEYAFDLEEECRRGSAIFMRTRRIVEEQETQDGGNPIEADVWVMDGPRKGTYQPKMWIFPSGMRNKVDQTPGAHSAGRLEVYKSRGRDCLGLTELTPEQLAAAEAMDAYLTAHPGYEPAQPAAQQAPAPAPAAPAPAPGPATPPPPPPATQTAPPASNYPLGEPPVPAGVGASSNGAYPEQPPF